MNGVALSPDSLRDLIAVRLLLERAALLMSIERRTGRDLSRVRHLQALIEVEPEADRLRELDSAFHTALYQSCGNIQLLKLIGELRREHRRPRADQRLGSPERAEWTQHHRELLAAYVAKDREGAVAALEAHLSDRPGT